MAETASPHFVGLPVTLAFVNDIIQTKCPETAITGFQEIPTGWNNKAIVVHTAEGRSLILRLSNAKTWPAAKIESEVAVLRFVATATTVPCPRLVAYGLATDSGAASDVHWMLMQRIDGVMLEAVWRNLHKDQKLALLVELEEITRALHSITFNAIGGLHFDAHGNPTVSHFWSGNGLDANEVDYTTRVAEKCAHDLRDLNPPTKFVESMQKLRDRVESNIPLFKNVLESLPPCPITLVHGDLAFRNMMVRNREDGSYTLSGLLDWEWACADVAFKDWLDTLLEETCNEDKNENAWIREQMVRSGGACYENIEGFKTRCVVYRAAIDSLELWRYESADEDGWERNLKYANESIDAFAALQYFNT
ncbi:kinase-like domain-containing protein [Chytriomyces sp. MP71]|nr:kinase-like domain-containing protein [Chytriomyces sp. MP71]